LQIDTVVQAALGTQVDAVHPGYGFLSERARFAQRCEEAGLIFIGPTAAQIEAVGDKLRARAAAEAAEVPVVPGGAVHGLHEANALAASIGTPLLIKAVGGGGGRGRRPWTWLPAKPARPLATRACTWSAMWSVVAMWKCRCWAMARAR
jgi:acetyl-CoA carboxylase biotin carboxylase subunit